MNHEEEIAIDNIMADIFALFKQHKLGPIDIVTVGTIIAGGMAYAGEMNKEFYMKVCEHAYDSSKDHEPRTFQ